MLLNPCPRITFYLMRHRIKRKSWKNKMNEIEIEMRRRKIFTA